MSSVTVTYEGVTGGPCPVCGGSGELLSQKSDFGGYRTLRHFDEFGREQVCTLPEADGMVFTTGGRWRYVPGAHGAPARHLTASMVVLDPDVPAVLLVHHRATGVWMFPGGHVDAGEDPAGAALREVFEETGVEARIVHGPRLELPGMVWLPSPWLTCDMPAPSKPARGPGLPAEAAHWHVDMLFVGVASSSAELVAQEDEVAGVRWMPLDELDSLAVRGEVPTVARLARMFYMKVEGLS